MNGLFMTGTRESLKLRPRVKYLAHQGYGHMESTEKVRLCMEGERVRFK